MTAPAPTPRTAVDILRAAREKIATPKAWIQGYYAKDKRGVVAPSRSSDAVCWCSVGVVRSVSHGQETAHALHLLCSASGYEDVAMWNDMRGRTHRQILAGFDRAIILAEQSVQS